LGDIELPSVTRVLKDLGLSYYPNATHEHRQRGSAVHWMCELIDFHEWDPNDTREDLIPYGRAYERFLADTGFKPELSEWPLHCPRYLFAGKLDRWGHTTNERWLVDIKSGTPPTSARIQVALYDYLLAQQPQGWCTDLRVVLQLKDTGDYKIQTYRGGNNGTDVTVGLAAVTLWKWKKYNGLLKS
jgi:hypothetical protein